MDVFPVLKSATFVPVLFFKVTFVSVDLKFCALTLLPSIPVNCKTLSPVVISIPSSLNKVGLIILPEIVAVDVPEYVNVFLDETVKKAPAPGSAVLFT